ncbi:MAG: hypothetical protein WA421_03335 [Nitrososphaeraceae archaeon]
MNQPPKEVYKVDNRKEFPSAVKLKLILHLTYTVYWKVLLANPLYVKTSHMSKRSNKLEVAAILSASKSEGDALLERKITLATEGFTTNKFCELTLSRTALSLAKECYSMKLDLLTNATVVDDAIRFVSEKYKDKDREQVKNSCSLDSSNEVCSN